MEPQSMSYDLDRADEVARNDHDAACERLAKKAQSVRNWACQECGRKMTAEAAYRAAFGANGCPKCGSTGVDLA